MGYDKTKSEEALEGIEFRVPGSLILVRSDVFGQSDGIAGRELARRFLITVAERPEVPETIIIMGSGLWLLEDAEVRAEMMKLVGRGVDIACCGDSCRQFKLDDSHLVGRRVDMEEIAAMLFAASRIIEV